MVKGAQQWVCPKLKHISRTHTILLPATVHVVHQVLTLNVKFKPAGQQTVHNDSLDPVAG